MSEGSRTPKYVVITPARNEASGIELTLQSVIGQTLRPAEWIVVDDGSKDGTAAVVERYAKEFPWISCVRRSDRGYRSPGGGVIDAFNEGYRTLRTRDWDFIVKLDADLTLEPQYFSACLKHFADRPHLGIGGGTVYNSVEGKPYIESNPRFHVRGATKIYRRACWDMLGGLLAAPGWDTLDEVKANMLHWETSSFDEIRALQRRATGACDGDWADYVKNGRANYISGYHPLFMLAKCVKRIAVRPYCIGAAGLCAGYLSAYFKKLPQVNDRVLIRYLRQQQLRRLRFADSIWK